MGLREAVFFDRETFGTDKLVVGERTDTKVVAAYPLPDRARADIVRIEDGDDRFHAGRVFGGRRSCGCRR